MYILNNHNNMEILETLKKMVIKLSLKVVSAKNAHTLYYKF